MGLLLLKTPGLAFARLAQGTWKFPSKHGSLAFFGSDSSVLFWALLSGHSPWRGPGPQPSQAGRGSRLAATVL